MDFDLNPTASIGDITISQRSFKLGSVKTGTHVFDTVVFSASCLPKLYGSSNKPIEDRRNKCWQIKCCHIGHNAVYWEWMTRGKASERVSNQARSMTGAPGCPYVSHQIVFRTHHSLLYNNQEENRKTTDTDNRTYETNDSIKSALYMVQFRGMPRLSERTNSRRYRLSGTLRRRLQ